MFAFGYINNKPLNHLFHSNKYDMFVQAKYQLHGYGGKYYTSKYYHNLIFFSLYLILSPYKVLFWRFHIYLSSNYVSHLSHGSYFHLRGLQICFYLLKLISDVSKY